MKERIRAALTAHGIALPETVLGPLAAYVTLFMERNRQMNLSAVRDPEEVAWKHVVDSLRIGAVCGIGSGERILDLGTGGGFPGVPILLAHPDNEYVFVEASAKKLQFVAGALRSVGADGNASFFHRRAEEAGRLPVLREKQDLVLARAVAFLPVLVEYALPLLAPGGRLAAAKSVRVEEEVAAAENAIRLLGGELEAVETYRLLPEPEPRRVVLIRKTGATPRTYPRRNGVPAKSPIP